MTPQDLRSIFDSHKGRGSDKWTSYFEAYDEHFRKLRDKPISLLEIGVQNGGSLEIWSKYFPAAKHIVGCDIDEKCRSLTFEDPRIRVVVGDANSPTTKEEIVDLTPQFDIIIDDGSHVVEDVLRTFSLYFPHLKPGGLFVVEDLHTSYWVDYGGGSDFDLSSMGFLKLLADIANRQFWRDENAPLNLLRPYADRYGLALDSEDLDIEQVSFFDSICVIRKGHSKRQNLRHITGTKFEVVDLRSSLSLSGRPELIEGIRFVAPTASKAVGRFVEILPTAEKSHREAAALKDRLMTLQEQLGRASHELAIAQHQIESIYDSRSWRLTRPLRKLSRLFSFLRGHEPRSAS